MTKVCEAHLAPSDIIDCDHPSIVDFEKSTVNGIDRMDLTAKAVALYYAVRDGIRYTPYYPFYLPEHYRASSILKSGRGYCVSKASLLCALGRASKIPSRLGFATVKNHLVTQELIEYMGSDLFVYHGYTEFYLHNRWVKATPAFNKELCRIHKVDPLEFNGTDDAVLQAFNSEKKQFMEYLDDLGTFTDVPVSLIVSEWKRVYGKDRVEKWIMEMEKTGGEIHRRNFYREKVVKQT